MSEPWVHFAILALIQLLLFIAVACYEKRLSDVPRVIGLGILIGIVFGIPRDLVAGEYFGLYSYALGFGTFFLVFNWVFLKKNYFIFKLL